MGVPARPPESQAGRVGQVPLNKAKVLLKNLPVILSAAGSRAKRMTRRSRRACPEPAEGTPTDPQRNLYRKTFSNPRQRQHRESHFSKARSRALPAASVQRLKSIR